MKINLNAQCKVRLTLKGYIQMEAKAPVEQQYNFDEKTSILTCPLWRLMHIFGSMLHMGMTELPFVKNLIEIEGEEL